MGYRTRFELEIIENNNTEIDYAEEIGELSDYGDCFDDEIKWYDHEEHMKEYSKKYPETVFCLKGEGDENDDIWAKYFKNGKMQVCKAKIIFDDYSENALV